MPEIQKCYHHSPEPRRAILIFDRCIFVSNLRIFDALVGRVGRRFLGIINARDTSDCNRATAKSRFCACVRSCSETTMSSSLQFILLNNFSRTRAFCSEDKTRERPIGQCTVALVEVLFTFCPPAPDDRANVMRSSDGGMCINEDVGH